MWLLISQNHQVCLRFFRLPTLMSDLLTINCLETSFEVELHIYTYIHLSGTISTQPEPLVHHPTSQVGRRAKPPPTTFFVIVPLPVYRAKVPPCCDLAPPLRVSQRSWAQEWHPAAPRVSPQQPLTQRHSYICLSAFFTDTTSM